MSIHPAPTLLLAAALLLSACGTRGPLTLPPPQQYPRKAPVVKPQPQDTTTASEVSPAVASPAVDTTTTKEPL